MPNAAVGLSGLPGTGLLLLLLVCCPLACERNPDPKEESPKAQEEHRELRVTPPGWLAGQRYEYALELESELTMSGRDKLLDLKLRAKLLLEPHSLEAGNVQFLARLSEAQVRSKLPDADEQLAALARELDEPFAFSLVDGKLTDMRVPVGASRFAESIVQAVAATWQFAIPAPSDAGKAWTAVEQDATGTYVAEYRLTERQGEFEKRKLHYEPIFLGNLGMGQTSTQLKPEVRSSTGSIILEKVAPTGSWARVRSIQSSEALATTLTAGSPVVAKTTLKLVLDNQSLAGSSALDRASVLAQTRAPGGAALATDSARFDALRVGEYTFETALGELEAQARNPESNKLYQSVRGSTFDPKVVEARKALLADQGSAFGAVTALLRTDAANVSRALAKIRGGSPVRRTLFDALGSAGSAEAQAALVSLMKDTTLDVSVRREAAFSLGRTELATPETVAAFQEYLDDPALRVHALYGLGTVSRRIREAGDAERAAAATRALTEALRRAKTPALQVHVLRAIANSGHPEAFDAVRPFLDAKPHKVRAAAVDALRLMDHPDVDAVVARQLSTPDSGVQMAALDAVAVRKPSDELASALATAAKNLPKPATRLKAIQVMAQWLPHRPELRTALEHAAKHDEQAQVRDAARTALGS